MCRPCYIEWRKAARSGTTPRPEKAADTPRPIRPATKPGKAGERRRSPKERLTGEPSRALVEARAILDATDRLHGDAYVNAVATDEFQAAIEAMSGASLGGRRGADRDLIDIDGQEAEVMDEADYLTPEAMVA